MKNSIKIPKAWVFEYDDVGWDNGRDLRLSKKASRSGLPRYHALEDYEVLAQIGEAAGMTLNVALCLADWDKDNVLRGFVGATHDPHGWDRKNEIDIEKFAKYRDTLEGTKYVDYSIHGLMHGVYDEKGILIHEREYFDLLTDGMSQTLALRSVEDFNRRLDCFLCEDGTVYLNRRESFQRLYHGRIGQSQCLINGFPFYQFCRHGGCCDGRAASKGFEFHIGNDIILHLDKHLHDVSALGITYCSHTVRVGDLAHISRMAEMIHYFFTVQHIYSYFLSISFRDRWDSWL